MFQQSGKVAHPNADAAVTSGSTTLRRAKRTGRMTMIRRSGHGELFMSAVQTSDKILQDIHIYR
jgi:hypothetical protein